MLKIYQILSKVEKGSENCKTIYYCAPRQMESIVFFLLLQTVDEYLPVKCTFQDGNIPVALRKSASLEVIHSKTLLCGNPELIKILMEKIMQISSIL